VWPPGGCHAVFRRHPPASSAPPSALPRGEERAQRAWAAQQVAPAGRSAGGACGRAHAGTGAQGHAGSRARRWRWPGRGSGSRVTAWREALRPGRAAAPGTPGRPRRFATEDANRGACLVRLGRAPKRKRRSSRRGRFGAIAARSEELSACGKCFLPALPAYRVQSFIAASWVCRVLSLATGLISTHANSIRRCTLSTSATSGHLSAARRDRSHPCFTRRRTRGRSWPSLLITHRVAGCLQRAVALRAVSSSSSFHRQAVAQNERQPARGHDDIIAGPAHDVEFARRRRQQLCHVPCSTCRRCRSRRCRNSGRRRCSLSARGHWQRRRCTCRRRPDRSRRSGRHWRSCPRAPHSVTPGQAGTHAPPTQLVPPPAHLGVPQCAESFQIEAVSCTC
jgi:hypothetical protein